MIDLTLNIIIFVIIPLFAIFLFSKKKKRAANLELQYKVLNARECSRLYKPLVLDIEDEIDEAASLIEGPCGFVMLTMTDAHYNHNSSITNMMKEAKAKEGTGGLSRRVVLKDLLENYDVKFYIGPSFRRKGKKKGPTIEGLLRLTDVENKLLLHMSKSHVGVVAHAKGNKFIDLYGPLLEYELDPSSDKFAVVHGVRLKEEDLPEEEQDNSQDESKE